MLVRRTLLAGLLACALGVGARANAVPLPTPTEDVVDRIRREYLREWILVTTPTTRFELRASEIWSDGLSELESRRASSSVPPRIPWSEVERIDARRTHALKGAVVGTLGGLVVGALVPSVFGFGSDEDAVPYAGWGAVTGAFFGACVGRLHRTEEPVYVAVLPPGGAAPVPADTAGALALLGTPPDSTSAHGAIEGAAPPAASVPPSQEEIERACQKLSSEDLLRIEGSFGRFVGHASTVSPAGLEGLRQETSSVATRSVRSLTWEQVNRVDAQRNGTMRGAVRGALITTGIALVATGVAFVAEGDHYSEGPYLSQFVAYFGALAIPVGTLIGALAGAASPYWHEVYHR